MAGFRLDERSSDRVRINGEFDSVAQFLSEYVSDISGEGVFVRTQDPPRKGTRLDFRFTIIDDELEQIEGKGVVARVVHAEPGCEDQAGMGLAFTQLTEASRKVIDRVLEQRARW